MANGYLERGRGLDLKGQRQRRLRRPWPPLGTVSTLDFNLISPASLIPTPLG